MACAIPDVKNELYLQTCVERWAGLSDNPKRDCCTALDINPKGVNMKDGGKVDINLIEENPSYQERHSRWTKAMDSFLKKALVEKAEPVRIIVRKTGNRYTLVAGHHLLKAARKCGFKNVYVDVIDSDATQKDYLDRFAQIIADYCRKSRNVKTFPEACACV
jgi:hypothetical protein